jgi:hypothetical protein
MSHDEIAGLLGAFALDAVDGEEAEMIRLHLADCPRCASEVAEHWEVTGLIANAGVDAPAELWDRIAARIGETEVGARRPAPIPLVSTATPSHLSPMVLRRRLAWLAVGTIAAAAAVVVALLAVQVGRLDHQVGQFRTANPQTELASAVQAALLDPSAQKVTLNATTSGRAPTAAAPGAQGRVAVLVILPNGSAFAINTGMPRLAADRTYQLWGFVRGQPVSLGLLGSHPHDAPFTVNPSAPVKSFAVTVELAGGAVRPTHAPVAESVTTA